MEDTCRWLEKRHREAVGDTDRADERIGVFTGITGAERWEEVKRTFNTEPGDRTAALPDGTDAARPRQQLSLTASPPTVSRCDGEGRAASHV